MKSLEERIADRKRRNEENAAIAETSPKEVAETGEADGGKKAGKGKHAPKEGEKGWTK